MRRSISLLLTNGLQVQVLRVVRQKFSNLNSHEQHGLREVLRWKLLGKSRGFREPYEPTIHPRGLAPTPNGNHVRWIGHSSFFLLLEGRRFLFDPVFSDYCAPFKAERFRRKAPPGMERSELGQVDAVLISHNHYDHLDKETIRGLANDTQFVVPRGLRKWFERLGKLKVREFDWGESATISGVTMNCLPAQHFSSRTFWDRDTTLWCGWLVENAGIKVYFAGDSGYSPSFRDIGERHGPIDLAMIPIGAYEPRWFMKPMHVNPEEAVQIHRDVRARKSVACHWGTFCLTDEPMSEPPVRLCKALRAAGIPETDFVIPAIGGSVLI